MAIELPDVAEDDPRDTEGAYSATLDEVTELLREQSRGWARQLRTVAAVDRLARRAGQGTAQFVQLEMAGSWLVGQLTATRWQWEAERMLDALPRTLEMLERGELLVHQAVVLLHRTRHCTVDVARAVEASVLPQGAGLVPADLTRRVDRAVLLAESERADPADAEQRHADAAAQRRTSTKPLQDGTGLAGAVLTAEQLVAWQHGLDRLERRERIADRATGVVRTSEQRRADLFAALPSMVLAGTAQDRDSDGARPPLPDPPRPAALRPWTLGPEQLAAQVVLHVHVPVSTVLDLSRAPGTLDRYGPVSAEHIRLLRPHSWRRVLVDAASGRPLALDDRATPLPASPAEARQEVLDRLVPEVVTDAEEPQHDPSARLARLVDVRDLRCCGPGCSSTHTHRDHLEPYPHGPTSAADLGLLSPRCHRAKHAGWTLVRHPDGSTTWTSPLGRVYDRRSPHAPPPHVDLHAEPPPVRRRPHSRTPASGPEAWERAVSARRSSDVDRTDDLTDVPDVLDVTDDDDPPPF